MKRGLYILFFLSAFASGQEVTFDPFTPFGGCENLYTEGNAINDCNEENDVTGISRHAASSTATGTVTSTSSNTDGGDYSARFLHTGGTNEQLNYKVDFPVTNGVTYTINVRVYRASGSNNWWLALQTSDGWGSFNNDRVTGGSGFYETLTVSSTANITGTAQITWNGGTGADGGDDNYWAYMTIESP